MKIKLTEKQNKILETVAIIMLIVFSLISYSITKIISGNQVGDRNITVFIDGKKITHIDGVKININVDITFIIGDKDGDYNTIEIKNKKVRCIDANCPDKICVSHSFLNDDIDNDMIVCAPHKLLITYQ
jgi:hypothetical protein